MTLAGKTIVLGVTGSIAAYKACALIRMLKNEGGAVRVVLTEAGEKFITPLTLSTLSGHKTYTSMFHEGSDWKMEHISLAQACDVLLIAPASADIIARLSHGIADDLLSTLALAVKSPLIIAPAMNDAMYDNPATAANIEILKNRSAKIIEPSEGKLASGKTGRGRLAELDSIAAEVIKLFIKKDFEGKKIVVAAGPTREPVDAVRFISNPSSGKMGYEIAAAAVSRGADTTLVSGPTGIEAPCGARLIKVNTALEMREAVLENSKNADIVIMAAAVSDFRPAEASAGKISKNSAALEIKLEVNPDILRELGENKAGRFLVGFSMDAGEQTDKALKKLKQKNLDLIVLNDLSAPGAGFGGGTNVISVINEQGLKTDYPLMSKRDAAGIILDRIMDVCLPRKSSGAETG